MAVGLVVGHRDASDLVGVHQVSSGLEAHQDASAADLEEHRDAFAVGLVVLLDAFVVDLAVLAADPAVVVAADLAGDASVVPAAVHPVEVGLVEAHPVWLAGLAEAHLA